jgi:GNAT superfamily N-acetyltransferase
VTAARATAVTGPDVERLGYTSRWIDGWACPDDEWQRIDALLEIRGWASLNRRTSRIRIIEDAQGAIVGFNVIQMIPFVGPMFLRPSARGTGLAAQLADDMREFLVESRARCWLGVAASPHAAQIMEARGMRLLDKPVYIMADPGTVEEV